MSASPVPPSDSAFLRLLPTEIRLEIFKYTDLVDLRLSSLEDHAIVYEEGILKPGHHAAQRGKIVGSPCTSATSCSWPLSRSLLLVNRQIYDEAREVFFEHHRFVLAAGHNANLRWLQSLPENCRRKITKIHLRFKAERHDIHELFKYEECEMDFDSMDKVDSIQDDDFEDPGDWKTGCCLICNTPGWDRLVAYITTSLSLARLHLAVDLGQIYLKRSDIYGHVSLHAAIAQRAIRRVSRPLITQLQGRIKSIFVFLPLHFELESSIEKSVMGTDFDALQFGKILPSSRCYWRPYALPGSDLGWKPVPKRHPKWVTDGGWNTPEPPLLPQQWGMLDVAQSTTDTSQRHYLDFVRNIRRDYDRHHKSCSTKEICDEEIKIVVNAVSPNGEVSPREV